MYYQDSKTGQPVINTLFVESNKTYNNMNDIEKAKHQVGDIHPNGKWVWTEYAPGKFDWKSMKGKHNKNKNISTSTTAKTDEDETKKKTTTVTEDKKGNEKEVKVEQKVEEDKYDAPEAKVQYSFMPDPKYGFKAKKSWTVLNPKTHKPMEQKRETYRKAYADVNLTPDDKLLKIANNPKGNPNVRMIAIEEAMARGIDESKINPKGKLQDEWDRAKEKWEALNPSDDIDVSEEEYEDYNSPIEGLGLEEWGKETFPDGDDGWDNPDNPYIKTKFNDLKSLKDRQQYDAFRDYMKRQDLYYDPPQAVLGTLNMQLDHFMTSKKRPMFVASGGAGAGKTSGFLKMARLNGMERYDPEKHKDDNADNYDWVLVDKDVNSAKEFNELLTKHNGKLLVFDDKDRLLTTGNKELMGMMKSLADSNPEIRTFKNSSTGEPETFTGQMLFLTNKTKAALNSDEDHKAIMSRADNNDIHFTTRENLEVLKDRYKTMGKKMENANAHEEQDIREELYDLFLNNKDKIDPQTFSVRTFEKMLELIDGRLGSEKKAEENEEYAAAIGGNNFDWKRLVLKNLNKAVEVEIGNQVIMPELSLEKSAMVSVDENDESALAKAFNEELTMSVEEAEEVLL